MAETKVTPLYVKTVAQKFDFKTIFLLDLSKRNITAIGSVQECVNLITLDLSKNNLTNVNGLERCINITVLNLSYNKLTTVSNLANL
ncbi:MAG: leucine-rich repeat domain-containing protein, partial [bacterium]